MFVKKSKHQILKSVLSHVIFTFIGFAVGYFVCSRGIDRRLVDASLRVAGELGNAQSAVTEGIEKLADIHIGTGEIIREAGITIIEIAGTTGELKSSLERAEDLARASDSELSRLREILVEISSRESTIVKSQQEQK